MTRFSVIMLFACLTIPAVLLVAFTGPDTPANDTDTPLANLSAQRALPVNNTRTDTDNKHRDPDPGPAAGNHAPNNRTWRHNLPHSLAGTDIDGQLRVDADGKLLITRDLRLVFDYFLSALGEEPLDVILSRIRSYLGDALPAPALASALNLMQGYVNVLQERSELRPYEPPLDLAQADLMAIRSQKQALMDINERHLPPEAIEAFFAEDIAFDQFMLSRLEILQNDELGEREKAQQIRLLEESLPEKITQTRARRQRFQDLNDYRLAAERNELDSTELHNLREQAVGSDAAKRLAKLDQQREAWKRRLDDWMNERQQLIQSSTLDEQTLSQELDARRQLHFEPHELRRVRALESLWTKGS